MQLGPARLAKTTQSPQRGRAVLLCRTTPATIYTIARTGAMLSIGQERSREKAALAAEAGCASDFTGPHHNWRALGRSFRLIQPPQSGGRCSQLFPGPVRLLRCLQHTSFRVSGGAGEPTLTRESACTVGDIQRNAEKKDKKNLPVIMIAPSLSSGSL